MYNLKHNFHMMFKQKDEGRKSRSVSMSTDATPTPPGSATMTIKIPNQADFLIYRSTPEGFVSWRSGDGSGSWFVKAICDVSKVLSIWSIH